MGAWNKLFTAMRDGLSKTRHNLVEKIESVMRGRSTIDDELFEELEAILLGADLGVAAVTNVIDAAKGRVAAEHITDPGRVRELVRDELLEILQAKDAPLARAADGPTVIAVVGVNGVGKTTSIGKLAVYLREELGAGKVVLGAADTFRAAAIDQLAIWANRSGAELVRHQEGSDPAAVAFDAVKAARARKAEYVILDTAGRLHTKSNLMEELKKIARVTGKEVPGAPHEVLLVLDATTGQNAVTQARLFQEAVNVTGIVLTKLDGTAKGGVVVAIAAERGLPVKFVGVGEGVEDLKPFDAATFVDALFAEGS